MAFPSAGIATAVTDGLVLLTGPDGAHKFTVYEYLSTTGSDGGQPKVIRTFVLTADETDALYTALGHS